MSFNIATVKEVGNRLGANFAAYTPETLQRGMEVELEHGTRNAAKGWNVTDDDATKTAQIALAHLDERADYYERLDAAVEGDALIIPWNIVLLIAAIAIVLVLIYMMMRSSVATSASQDAVPA